MALPVAPFQRQVQVTTPAAEAAVTGRATTALMAATRAAAMAVAVWPAVTAIRMRMPSMRRVKVPDTGAAALKVMPPLAAWAASSSARASNQVSMEVLAALSATTMA